MSDVILTVEDKRSILDRVVNKGQIMGEMSRIIRMYEVPYSQYACRLRQGYASAKIG